MNCPKCRAASLRSLVPYSSEPPYRCVDCGGTWVRLEEAARLGDLLTAPEAPPAAGGESARDTQAGLCPNGHGILTRARVELDGRFYLDRCGTCAGVWFDQGEWERLATANLLDNLGALWTRAWQQQQDAAAGERQALLTAEQRFGPELTRTLLQLAERLRDEPLRSEAVAFLGESIRKRRSPAKTI